MSPPSPDSDPQPLELPPRKPTLLQRLALWVERANAFRAAVEEARSRSSTLDVTFKTIERDSDMGGGLLAGALSYRLFVFALPGAFFVVSGLGLLASALGVEPHVISNSVGLAGVVTQQVSSTAKGGSSWWVAITSFVAVLYASRGLCRGVAIVHSLAWHRSAASVKVPPRTIGIFDAALLGQLGLVIGIGAVNHQTVLGSILGLAVFVAGVAGLWLVVSLNAPHADARWTDLIPGSLFYAIGFGAVLVFNTVMLQYMIQSKTSTYGALGTAAVLLLAFFLLGRVMVGAAVLNATLYEHRRRLSGAGAEPLPPAAAPSTRGG